MRCKQCGTSLPRPVEIGDAHGRIALYLDKDGALALADALSSADLGAIELRNAVAKAYPAREDDDE